MGRTLRCCNAVLLVQSLPVGGRLSTAMQKKERDAQVRRQRRETIEVIADAKCHARGADTEAL